MDNGTLADEFFLSKQFFLFSWDYFGYGHTTCAWTMCKNRTIYKHSGNSHKSKIAKHFAPLFLANSIIATKLQKRRCASMNSKFAAVSIVVAVDAVVVNSLSEFN